MKCVMNPVLAILNKINSCALFNLKNCSLACSNSRVCVVIASLEFSSALHHFFIANTSLWIQRYITS